MARHDDTPARDAWLARLGTLGDLTRLRLLRLLEKQELGVGELARATRLPQSTVSRHLKMLFEAQFVQKRSEGTTTLYVHPQQGVDADALALWTLTRERLGANPEFDEDDARLSEVLAERRTDSRTFFGRVGREWDHLRDELFGQRCTGAALLGLFDPAWVVADIGSGTGEAAELMAPFVAKVIVIDREVAMLAAAKARLGDFDNIEFREGDIAALPAKNNEFHAAIVMLVLHHLPHPAAALREIARTVRPGGTILVVDMVAHGRDEFRITMGHQHLGFGEADVAQLARSAGLQDCRYRRLRAETERKGPGLFAASMRRQD
ncbi:MAG: metalloregulator ArsR/SmtB family transcription factor [Phycisphaerae bacterium]|nr:metalloregulator ArsR/SmtB family transcription factor [Phycisphaerae bacterium]